MDKIFLVQVTLNNRTQKILTFSNLEDVVKYYHSNDDKITFLNISHVEHISAYDMSDSNLDANEME